MRNRLDDMWLQFEEKDRPPSSVNVCSVVWLIECARCRWFLRSDVEMTGRKFALKEAHLPNVGPSRLAVLSLSFETGFVSKRHVVG